MGKHIIITENEKKQILKLYEQKSYSDSIIEYKKENDFLKRYVGKTFNTYLDDFNRDLENTYKIDRIYYNGNSIKVEGEVSDSGLKIEAEYKCLYNPSTFDTSNTWSEEPFGHAKQLLNDIIIKGKSLGIVWCKKPKADFGLKNVNESSNLKDGDIPTPF